MAAQKVAYDGHTLIDLTQDTAVESDVASGKWFHKANGDRVQGTASGGGSGTATFPETVTVNFNQTVSGVPPITYAYRAPDTNSPNTVVWTFKRVGVLDPAEFFDNEILCVAHVDKIRDGFYVFVHDDQWIEVTNAVYLHCASFNPLDDSLATYGIGDDYNVYYVIPTSSTCTITVTDGND